MTNTQFTKQLFTILDDLLETGITSCNIHQARLEFDYLFDTFEEFDGVEIDDLTISPESTDVTHGENY